MKVVTAEQMQEIDRRCAESGLPTEVLMESAGRAVAEAVRQLLGSLTEQRILLLIGPGNNGGDGLVAARHLHDWGAKVTLYLCSQRPRDDANLKLVEERKIACIDGTTDEGQTKLNEALASAMAVIDALFGTGKSRPLTGIYVPVLDCIAQARKERPGLRIIAVDLPSGLNADNGAVDPACLRCDYTITLGLPKVGLYCLPGVEYAGRVSVVDIGIPAHLAYGVDSELITGDWCRGLLPVRPLGANKGSFGRVLMVAGSINYIGAAYLAGSAAMRVGAGLVTLATPRSLLPVMATKLTETTYLPLPESKPGVVSPGAAWTVHQYLSNYNVLLVGCGLGQGRPVIRFVVASVLKSRRPLPSLVIDADGLNALAQVPNWWQYLPDDAILTPHPGEMARLTGLAVGEVQEDRLGVARRFAGQWHKTVVLKGACTVVAAPDNMVAISGVANPGLASAGTGDVLAGAVAGLVAQGLPLFEAAALGVYLHGEAGERVKDSLGDAGMVASDLLEQLPVVIKRLKETRAGNGG